jgi:hypothetical protein
MLLELFCLTLVAAPPTQGSTAVRRELDLREAALFPERRGWDVIASADWRDPYAALEAVARRAPGRITESQRKLAVAGLEHRHPNVRASALLVYARHALVLPPPALELVADPLPSVRGALARAAAHLPGRAGDELLLALTEDEDRGVAHEARAQLLARGKDSVAAQLVLFELDPPRLDAQGFLDALDVLERAPSNEELSRALLDRLTQAEAAGNVTDDLRARSALCEALVLVQGKAAAGTAEPHSITGPWFPASRVLEHWLTPLAGETPALERRRRRWLVEAACRTQPADISRALLERALALEGSAGKGDLMSEAIEVHFSAPTVRYEDPEPFSSPSWDAASTLDYFERAAREMDVWGSGPRYLLFAVDSVDRELAEAACDAVLDTWDRMGDPDAALLAVEIFERTGLSEQVYRRLVRSHRAMPAEDAVYAWWRRQSFHKRLALLSEHNRSVRFGPWREALLDLWAGGTARSVSIPELLTAFEGDEEVRDLLHLWLSAELERMEAGEAPDEETTRGPWREAEARALWLAKAWVQVAGDGRLEQEQELLLRAGKLGKEFGKFLAADLAKSAEGRRALSAIVERPELSRRMRLEVLLVDSDLVAPDDLRELFAAYAGCDADLKLRILKRAAGLDDDGVRAHLVEVALAPAAGQRQRAIESLATAGPPETVVPLLLRVLCETGDYDLKRATIAALGEVALESVAQPLLELYLDATARELLGDELLPALVRIELRGRGELGPELAELWRARADEGAAVELEQRLRGRRLPAREFVYKGWLAAAEALAGAGRLEAALGDSWWRWDGRLLMELAQLVRGAPVAGSAELARRLDRAALVALLGEGEASDRSGLLVRCRARLLQDALRARDWREAHGWVRVLLDDWRTGRTTPNAVQSVFGSHDPDVQRDPLHRLLTLEATTRAWQALDAERVDEARELAREAESRVRDSAAARQLALELERAIDAREK